MTKPTHARHKRRSCEEPFPALCVRLALRAKLTPHSAGSGARPARQGRRLLYLVGSHHPFATPLTLIPLCPLLTTRPLHHPRASQALCVCQSELARPRHARVAHAVTPRPTLNA